MLVKNITEFPLKGHFFGHGDILIEAGESKDLPPVIVELWNNMRPDNPYLILVDEASTDDSLEDTPVKKPVPRRKTIVKKEV